MKIFIIKTFIDLNLNICRFDGRTEHIGRMQIKYFGKVIFYWFWVKTVTFNELIQTCWTFLQTALSQYKLLPSSFHSHLVQTCIKIMQLNRDTVRWRLKSLRVIKCGYMMSSQNALITPSAVMRKSKYDKNSQEKDLFYWNENIHENILIWNDFIYFLHKHQNKNVIVIIKSWMRLIWSDDRKTERRSSSKSKNKRDGSMSINNRSTEHQAGPH